MRGFCVEKGESMVKMCCFAFFLNKKQPFARQNVSISALSFVAFALNRPFFPHSFL